MKNLAKKTSSFILLFVAVLVTVFGLQTFSAPATEAAPFSCSTGFYQVMNGQLKVLDPDTATYMDLGPTSAATNAMGYNIEDDHIYALGTVSGNVHLFRYEHDGATTDLGAPGGLPNTAYVAGDFDDSGNLWVRPFAAGTTLWSIDVSSNTASSLTTSISTFVSELVFINGFLYGLNGAALTRIDLSDGTTNFTTVPELSGTVPAFSAFGAGWTTIDDELYLTWNVDGVIYRIDDYETGGSPTATPVLQGQVPSGSNDGASCPNATSPVPGVAATNDSYLLDLTDGRVLEINTSSGTLLNDTGDSITVIDYTQPSNGSLTLNPDGSFSYTADKGFHGSDTFTYTISDVFDLTSTATVTITVSEADASSGTSDEPLADTGANLAMPLFGATTLLLLGAGLLIRRLIYIPR